MIWTLALGCVVSIAAQAATTTQAAKSRAKAGTSKTAPVVPAAPALSPQMQLARTYSPIQYCHGASFPAATWMQIKDFRDKHSPAATPAAGSGANATDPRLETIPKLEYPLSMVASKLDGAVAVMVAVNREGTTSDALVVCSNHPEFTAAALLAVKAATFRPATRDGQPIESVATLPIDFHP